ncbi:hypothetical protein CB1_001005003 [Camelus ferus]|nr:hypothetical protein CB1_001005003 [Camelus ferus]
MEVTKEGGKKEGNEGPFLQKSKNLHKSQIDFVNQFEMNSDEIMQQEIRPLLAVDIIEQLHRQFAILSGGQGKDGAPIITFPEFVGFKHISHEDFLNVMTYLTSIPRIFVVAKKEDTDREGRTALYTPAFNFLGYRELNLVSLFGSTAFQTLTYQFSNFLCEEQQEEAFVRTYLLTASHLVPFNIKQRQWMIVLEYLCYILLVSFTLCSVEAASIGFIIVIDRRRDKWSSIKASLTRIAVNIYFCAITIKVAFPGNLQLIFILRPSCFIQRTFTDIGIKFYRDEFKMKVPIIMLNSISDLHGYIDKSQLTEDLGGTLEYRHSQWINHRTAIENFALALKTTAQMLQTFGACLATTELPRSVPSSEDLLMSHTRQRGQLQVKLTLKNLLAEQAEFTDIGDSVMHVEQLLKEYKKLEGEGQEPLEKAQLLAVIGDQLIQSHHYAMDSIRPRCTELRHLCDDFINENKKKHEILEKSLELHRQLDKVSQWCDAGIYLLASQAVDKCQSREGVDIALNDIETFLDTAKEYQLPSPKEFYSEFELILTLDVKAKAQKVLQKLGDVQEIFHKRQMSLMKLAARQTRPVQPVAPHPESSPKWVSPKISQPSALAPHQKTSEEPYAEADLSSLGKEDDETKFEVKNEEILESSHDGENPEPEQLDSSKNLSPSRVYHA